MSIWESILRESSKKAKSLECQVVILGDELSGKSTFLDSLSDHVSEDSEPIDCIVEYKVVDTEKSLDNIEPQTFKMHLWVYNPTPFSYNIEFLGDISPVENFGMVICVDFSRPESCFSSLEYWLKVCRGLIGRSVSNENRSQFDQRYRDMINYLNSIRSFSQNESSESLDRLDIFPFPVIVIGTKADSIDERNYQSSQAIRILQGRIRSLCQYIGASFIMTSSLSRINVGLVKEHLLHRLFSNVVTEIYKPEDGLTNMFIPAGWDTVDFISISTGLSSSQVKAIHSHFESYSSQPLEARDFMTKSSQGSERTAAAISIEAEADWLQQLHSLVLQTSSTSSSSTPGSSSNSTLMTANSSSMPANSNLPSTLQSFLQSNSHSSSNVAPTAAGRPSLSSTSAHARPPSSAPLTSSIPRSISTTTAPESSNSSSGTNASMLSFSNLSSAASQERRSIIERKSVNLPSSQASLETLLQSGSTSSNPTSSAPAASKQEVTDFFKKLAKK